MGKKEKDKFRLKHYLSLTYRQTLFPIRFGPKNKQWCRKWNYRSLATWANRNLQANCRLLFKFLTSFANMILQNLLWICFAKELNWFASIHLLFNSWLHIVNLTIYNIFIGDRNLALKGLAFKLIYCSMYTVYILYLVHERHPTLNCKGDCCF